MILSSDRDAYLGEVIIGLTSVVKVLSQMLNLAKAVHVDTGVRDQVEERDEDHVNAELANDRPHVDLSQPFLSQPCHLALIQTVCSYLSCSTCERHLFLEYPLIIHSLRLSLNEPRRDADTPRRRPVPLDHRR